MAIHNSELIIRKNLARFLLDNSLSVLAVASEFNVRIINTISDGDYLEFIIIQVRPLGRDGETLFYRAWLFGDEIVQCDYKGNVLTP